MKIDCLVAEIGSTTTVVNAFNIQGKLGFVGKGVSATTVTADVRVGLMSAIDNLKRNLAIEHLEYEVMLAASSAAGGLKMTVAGLVYEMTVRAAKEAALNAGANIHHVTAGRLNDDDLKRIIDIKPNIILVAGGTDYGEKDVPYENLIRIESLNLNIPLIYAGNIENHYRIRNYFQNSLQNNYLKICENVYPRVDFLNILPLRKVIYETFEEHIIHAKGMQYVKDMVNSAIMPTPGSVMECAMLLYEDIGNLIVIDVGGATTDIHSITIPSDEFKKYAEGEAKEKRTVEGDLGVFVNRETVAKHMNKDKWLQKLNVNELEYQNLLQCDEFIPITPIQKQFIYELTKICVNKALDRHVGDIKKVYTSSGQKVIPEGRDLTQVQTIILTGGPLIHLQNTENIIKEYLGNNPSKLLPREGVRIIRDEQYIMSSIGVLSRIHRDASKEILRKSLNI